MKRRHAFITSLALLTTAWFAVAGGTGGSCDFDGNGLCDVDDIDMLIADIVAGANSIEFDLDGDGLVNLDDRDEWLSLAGAENLASGKTYLLGDTNLDGAVDMIDFFLWNANKFTEVTGWSSGDFNADGVVDVPDFNLWNDNKFTSA